MKAWSVLILALVLIPFAASEYVLVNSDDWRDVFTGLQYAAVTSQEASFIIDREQGLRLLESLDSTDEIILINGNQPPLPNTQALLRSRQISIAEVYRSRDAIETNEEFVTRANTNGIIIVDDAYGYDALTAAPYANARNASVLFASPSSAEVISDRSPSFIIELGQLPSAVSEEISQFNPEVINKQDRFSNNFAFFEKFVNEFSTPTVILTDGDFIESQLVMDQIPILFTGRQVVPQEVTDLLSEKQFRAGIMIGNSLAPNAQSIKDSTGISIFIKFAQGRNQEQFALDTFPLPKPNPLILLDSAIYDPTEQQLLITYQNPGEAPVYFSATISNSEGFAEDIAPIFLESGSYKTITYELPFSDSVDYSILYGAFPRTLELLLSGQTDVDTISVGTPRSIRILELTYDLGSEELQVLVENTGSGEVFVVLEAQDVNTASGSVTAGSEVYQLSGGEKSNVAIPLALTKEDIARNAVIELEAFYGPRQNQLFQNLKVTMAFSIQSNNMWKYVVLALLVAAALLFFVLRKK